MCGITGIAGQGSGDVIRAMTRTLAHRGPDGEGYYRSDGIALGHRRLSVIDLETGQQPMTTRDGRYTIVFNGEIYNFRELRKGLKSRGTLFRTRSDTEVLLEAYAAWGKKAVQRLRGMFAFGVWDARDRRLFAARDRLGLKPLYFARTATSLIFASEMKALLAHPETSREIDFLGLDDFLTYLYVPAPRTIFRGICELPPGHWLEWRDGQISLHRYWDVTFDAESQPLAESVEKLSATLREAVRLRLVSDVPLGVFLSGGLDSSTVAALMARFAPEPVKAFTLGFDEGHERYCEWEYAQEVGETIGARTQQLTVPAQSAELLGAVTRHFDEPFGNPTSLLIYQLSQVGRQHLTVALVGDGGDEVFLGYPRYRGVALGEHYRRVPGFLRNLAARAASRLPEPGNGNHLPRRMREFAEGCCQSPERMYLQWVSYFGSALRHRLYSGDLAGELRDYDSSEFLLSLFRRCKSAEVIDRVNYVDLHSFLPFNILRYADRMSMAHGLELRAPFTDHVLVEQMARVLWRYKLRGNQSKLILRKVAEKLLPRRILSRPKLGLNPPMGLWLRGQLKPLLREYLSPGQVRQRGYFRPAVIQELIGDHLRGRRDNSLHLWALISLEEWHRQYLDVNPIPVSNSASLTPAVAQ